MMLKIVYSFARFFVILRLENLLNWTVLYTAGLKDIFIIWDLKKLGFTPCKPEHPLPCKAWGCKKKKHKKIKAYRKSV